MFEIGLPNNIVFLELVPGHKSLRHIGMVAVSRMDASPLYGTGTEGGDEECEEVRTQEDLLAKEWEATGERVTTEPLQKPCHGAPLQTGISGCKESEDLPISTVGEDKAQEINTRIFSKVGKGTGCAEGIVAQKSKEECQTDSCEDCGPGSSGFVGSSCKVASTAGNLYNILQYYDIAIISRVTVPFCF